MQLLIICTVKIKSQIDISSIFYISEAIPTSVMLSPFKKKSESESQDKLYIFPPLR